KVETTKPKDNPKEKKDEKEPAAVAIDFAGIDQRVVPLPIPVGELSDLQAGAAGQLYYLQASAVRSNPGGTLFRFELGKRKSDSMATGILDYTVAAGHKKVLIATLAGAPATAQRPTLNWSIIDVSGPPGTAKGGLNFDAVEVRIEPRAEWKQIFDEAWRVNRDYFYDPNMHGADWAAMKKKYEPFLADLSCRSDLYTVIQWMCSELGVGHHYLDAPLEKLNKPQSVSGGLLGADYAIASNRYQIKKIFG